MRAALKGLRIFAAVATALGFPLLQNSAAALAPMQSAVSQSASPQPTPAPPPPGVDAALDSARAIRGQNLQVSVMTFGPGDLVWERFGHDALRVRDTLSGQDYVYHWGMFDFEAPGFYTRFLTGETAYWMIPASTAETNQFYVYRNRTIRVQDLALTAVQRGALLDFLVWNSADANKYYRYDYYQDNCATRLRDALDRLLGGQIKAALDTARTTFTWRSETERSTSATLPVYAGIELALGRNADVPLTQWTAGFMPERLADALATIILRNENGQRYRLVARDTLTFEAKRVPVPIDPPERLALAALVGLTFAGLIALLADSRFKVLRFVLIAVATLWFVLGGTLGTALLLAGTVTKHIPYMGSNTTLWQLHPILLFAALFVPVALARREASNITRAIVAITALFAVFGAVLQLVPAYRQHSGVIIAVTLPIHVAFAVAVLRLPVVAARRRASAA